MTSWKTSDVISYTIMRLILRDKGAKFPDPRLNPVLEKFHQKLSEAAVSTVSEFGTAVQHNGMDGWMYGSIYGGNCHRILVVRVEIKMGR